jgi:serine/threonine protein kinase
MGSPDGPLLGGRYQLVEPAGQGGMAVVWRGLVRGAAGFHRPVAVKQIHRRVAADPGFVGMFVEEARVGADLDHPNVVQIHDFGLEDRVPYLVLEWVEGVDLLRWSKSYVAAGWHAPWHLVAAIGIEVCKGLHAAHTRADPWGTPAPTYHRDVTPGNVLVGLNGHVKVADFGLARAMDRGSVTAPNVVKGKVGYLAPEMFDGASASVQSDLYGVGIVLWEVLAGQPLYRGRTDLETLRRVRRGEVPSLSGVRPDAPSALRDLVHRCLAKDPKDRFDSARQVARELAQQLRRVAEPTDDAVLGETVALARRRLGMPARSRPPEALRNSMAPLEKRTRRRTKDLLAPPADPRRRREERSAAPAQVKRNT